MTEPRWLLKSAVLAVHNMLIARFGGPGGLRDEGLLDSALARPVNLYLYEDCRELPHLTAAYATGIIRNHPFLDGNKRMGFMAAFIFLDRNGLTLRSDEATAAAMTLSLAASEIGESDYTSWLDRNC